MEEIAAQQSELIADPKYQEINKGIEDVSKQIQKMDSDGINNNSSKEEIDKYNGLIKQYEGYQSEFELAGFGEIRKQQAERIRRIQS